MAKNQGNYQSLIVKNLGASLIEMALLISLIAIIAMSAVSLTGKRTACKICKVNYIGGTVEQTTHNPLWYQEVASSNWFEGGDAHRHGGQNCSNCDWCKPIDPICTGDHDYFVKWK